MNFSQVQNTKENQNLPIHKKPKTDKKKNTERKLIQSALFNIRDILVTSFIQTKIKLCNRKQNEQKELNRIDGNGKSFAKKEVSKLVTFLNMYKRKSHTYIHSLKGGINKEEGLYFNSTKLC